MSLFSQCFPDSIEYFEKGEFVNTNHSNLYYEIRSNLNSNNFKKCAELSDSLFSKYPNTKLGRHYSTICYDQTNQTEKAIQLLIENFNNGNCVFQRPRQKAFMWSDSIRKLPDFIRLCPNYDGEYLPPPASMPELRDSLIEILIWTMDSPEKNKFNYLKSEKYFSTYPHWNKKEFGKKLENKFDRLINKYGFPTPEKVGERMCLIVAMSIIIHSPNVDFMEKYLSDIESVFSKSTLALLQDKISVFKGVPQKYGTQLFYSQSQNQKVFYPIESPEKINQLRMKMGLDTLEKYAKSNGMLIETKYNQELNK